MDNREFDEVKCKSTEGTETEFYDWALHLDRAWWSTRTDKFVDIQYLFFRWKEGCTDGFEVSMRVELDVGHYTVCNVTPLKHSRLTPCEYNKCLKIFVHSILYQYNLEHQNNLHIEYITCGGKLTYMSDPDMSDVWTEKDTKFLQQTMVNEIYRSRIELMEDIFNRYSGECISPAIHAAISAQIADILVQRYLRPEGCNLVMAAQCFAAICLNKQDPTGMFDSFLTDSFRAELEKLIGVNTFTLENVIHTGAVHISLGELFDEKEETAK